MQAAAAAGSHAVWKENYSKAEPVDGWCPKISKMWRVMQEKLQAAPRRLLPEEWLGYSENDVNDGAAGRQPKEIIVLDFQVL